MNAPNQAIKQSLDASTQQTLHAQAVTVHASARLHMGFFDLHGGLGRRFGSLGLALKTPQLQLSLRPHQQWQAHGQDSARALQVAQKIFNAVGIAGAAEIHIHQAIAAHSGLGSGTQLALALGAAINQAFGLNLTLAQIATITQRATRSGIGLGTFAQGGLIVDGGRSASSEVPPVLAHMDFPDWPILLILQKDFQGVHGNAEIAAFENLPQFPEAQAQALCREVLMRALPAIQERDLYQFALAIQQIQAACGDYFAPAQGGQRYASRTVHAALQLLQAQGVQCVGQSSWGPTGFAILPDMQSAIAMQQLGQQQFADSGLQWLITQADNAPAQILTSVV